MRQAHQGAHPGPQGRQLHGARVVHEPRSKTQTATAKEAARENAAPDRSRHPAQICSELQLLTSDVCVRDRVSRTLRGDPLGTRSRALHTRHMKHVHEEVQRLSASWRDIRHLRDLRNTKHATKVAHQSAETKKQVTQACSGISATFTTEVLGLPDATTLKRARFPAGAAIEDDLMTQRQSNCSQYDKGRPKRIARGFLYTPQEQKALTLCQPELQPKQTSKLNA